jgi:hypothetical protein
MQLYCVTAQHSTTIFKQLGLNTRFYGPITCKQLLYCPTRDANVKYFAFIFIYYLFLHKCVRLIILLFSPHYKATLTKLYYIKSIFYYTATITSYSTRYTATITQHHYIHLTTRSSQHPLVQKERESLSICSTSFFYRPNG